MKGVSHVENNLKVHTVDRTAGEVIDDSVITAKVRVRCWLIPAPTASRSMWDTRDGVVQLNGFVSSTAEQSLARDLAAKVKGVKSVQNNLAVHP